MFPNREMVLPAIFYVDYRYDIAPHGQEVNLEYDVLPLTEPKSKR